LVSISCKCEHKVLDDMFKKFQPGRCVNTFWGLGQYEKRGPTMTGQIASYHVYGRGVPKRDPLGFSVKDRRFIDRLVQRCVQGKITSKQMLEQVGKYMDRQVVLRMNKGQSTDGKRFEEYSEKYKAFRRELQRQVHTPNLTYTGIMKESFGHEVFMT